MNTHRLTALALLAGACLLLVAGTAGAGGSGVGCGSTLTKSTTLTTDIVGCTGTALVIGADGITVNLAGHTVSGTNAAGSEGIASDGYSGVQIFGGSITDFRVNGVGIRGGHGNAVRGLTIRRIGDGGVEPEASAGIALHGSPNGQIVGNDVANDVSAWQADGADVVDSPGSLVQGNRLNHNAWDGLALIGSANSRVVGNELNGNANHGTEINGGCDNVAVTGNHADGNQNVGIVLGSARGVRVAGNSTSGNDTGIFFFDLHDSLITLNTAHDNRDGIDLLGGQFGSGGNRVIGNVTNHNSSTGLGIAFGADDNVVTGNIANENQGGLGEGGGIYVVASINNQLIGNVANGNLDTGIAVYEDYPGGAAGNSVKSNTANRNAGHGMDVVTGTIDKGGNRASGNAVPPQCVNVVCSS